MFPKKWKEFRSAVFKRDGRRCQFVKSNGKKCNSKKRIVPHHIRPKSKFPILVWDTNNGITLCNYHHVYKVTGHEDIYITQFMKTVIENKGK